MKKFFLFSTCLAMSVSLVAGGGRGAKTKAADTKADATAQTKAVPEYKVIENATVDLAGFPQDKDGYYVIFDGKTFNGWRGYGKDHVPTKWTIDNGAIKFNGSGGGEAQDGDGGDLIFTHKFKNFELEVEWKVAKGGNSGIFYLAQEVATTKDGKQKMEPIYISSPEYQVLDNENHPDAKLGVDGNRKSASLYDMIPAVPQNSKPYGEWNKAKIMVYKGTVVHGQNDQNVVSTTCGLPSGRRCSRRANSAPRNGRWLSSCSTTAAAHSVRVTSASRITATMYGSATSALRCSTNEPVDRLYYET